MVDSDTIGCSHKKSAGCHHSAEFFKGKNKMAVIYFKVKYDFSTNEARNKCNTSFPYDFD